MSTKLIMTKGKRGTKIWKIHGNYHREDGPALITATFSTWYIHGRRHRTDGPAVIYVSENKRNRWYINGKSIHSNRIFQSVSKITDEDMTILILKYGDIK